MWWTTVLTIPTKIKESTEKPLYSWKKKDISSQLQRLLYLRKKPRIQFTCLFIHTVLFLHPEARLRWDDNAVLLRSFSEKAGLLLIRKTTCSFFPVLSTSSIWFTIFMLIWLLKKSFATAPMMPNVTMQDSGITQLLCAFCLPVYVFQQQWFNMILLSKGWEHSWNQPHINYRLFEGAV